MISHKHKCIFVHVPKTGGTTIENLIWPREADRTELNLWMGFVKDYHNKYQTGGLQHLLASQVKEEVGKKVFDTYFKFAIVRNPWDKAVSQYSYMKKRQDLRKFIGMSKDDCLKKYLSLIQKTNHVQWDSQYKFVTDKDDKIIVDFIGKFESFSKDVNVILEKLEICNNILGFKFPKKIPHTNKSHRSHYREYYDAESKEIVQNIYQKDIELFEYQF